jgi:hypothetical protein
MKDRIGAYETGVCETAPMFVEITSDYSVLGKGVTARGAKLLQLNEIVNV